MVICVLELETEDDFDSRKKSEANCWTYTGGIGRSRLLNGRRAFCAMRTLTRMSLPE